MALNNKPTLTSDAQLIRSAYKEGYNTAERVGKMFVDLINEIDVSLTLETTSRETAISNVQSELLKLSQLVTDQTLSGSDVVEFLGVDDFVDSVQDKTDKSAGDEGCAVVYSPTHSGFFLRIFVQMGTSGMALYYKAWSDSSQWNRWLESAGGYRPRANKLYVSSDGALYWWNSVNLLNISAKITEALSQMSSEIQNLYKNDEVLSTKNEKLSKEIGEVSAEIANIIDVVNTNIDAINEVKESIKTDKENLNEHLEIIAKGVNENKTSLANLATINGHSLLVGGDIVIIGDGVLEEIPDEFIKQLGET